MKSNKKTQKGTLCPCGSLKFKITECDKESKIETWVCSKCKNQFEIEWNE